MIRRIFLFLVGIVLIASVSSASAQDLETRVSKKLKAFDWLNVAVVDGNQVEGGLHVYADYATLLTDLKVAQVKVGMMVVLNGSNGALSAGTYRLDAWATTTALPLSTEWKRTDNVVVANIAARDALSGLATGTIVAVNDDGTGEKAAYFYDGTDFISLGGGGTTGGGFIAVGQGAIAYTSGFDGDDLNFNNADVGVIDTSDPTKKISTFQSFEFELTNNSSLPFIAYPKAWNKPSFYINVNGTVYPLTDCWTVTYAIVQNVEYQQWQADVAFADGSTLPLKLIVR